MAITTDKTLREAVSSSPKTVVLTIDQTKEEEDTKATKEQEAKVAQIGISREGKGALI